MRVEPPGAASEREQIQLARDVFTNRESESEAFKTALKTFRRDLDRDGPAGPSRTNLLTFFGMGGIGKTALSERFESWVRRDLPLVNGWGPPPPTRVDATARIDLHGSAGHMDVVATLLALRAGVSELQRRWPVFDLALAAYWSAIRPGEQFPSFRAGTEFADSVTDTLTDILSDLGSFAEIAGAGTGAGIGVRGIRKLVAELRRRRDLNVAVEAYPGFEAFLIRCMDTPSVSNPCPEIACEIAGALSWELSRIFPSPLAVVFVDTIERLTLDPRREAEGHLNRLAFNMPNVLFVLTGRDSVTWWDDSRVAIPHRGPQTWPQLSPNAQDIRQHLVGNLSPEDRKSVIVRGCRQYKLTMSDAVAQELADASSGLPQYLELALQVAISVRDLDEDREIRTSDVTGSLDSLVMRVLEDVPPDEQRAIRGACLFRVFDTALMASAADVDRGCADRAVQRPMIDLLEGERYPYRMHDAVREAIRGVDHSVTGGWSEDDWVRAAERGIEAARERHDQAKLTEDNRAVLDAIGVAITLACQEEARIGPSPNEAYKDWLTRAVVYGPSIQGLKARIPASSRTKYGQQLLNFVTAKSVETPIDERFRLLREIFDSEHPLRIPAGRHLGYLLKSLYRWDDAIDVFEELVQLDPSPVNMRQIPMVLSLARRFKDAREKANGETAAQYVRRVAAYAHGRPSRYFREIPDKMATLRANGRTRELIEEQSDLLVRRVFFHGDASLSEIHALQAEAELAGHLVALRGGLLAEILDRQCGPDRRRAVLAQLKDLDLASGSPGTIGFRYALAELSDAYVAGDLARVRELAEEMDTLPFRSRSWIPVESMLAALDVPLTQFETQWLVPQNDVVKRWGKHLDKYAGRHGREVRLSARG